MLFLLSSGYQFPVSLPYSAVSRNAVSYCGISWSYSLTFSILVYYNNNRSALLCKLLNDQAVCQCTQTMNYLTIIIVLLYIIIGIIDTFDILFL